MARQKNITARSLLEDQQNSAAQLLTDSGLDAWTNRKYELKQSQQDFSNYISSGNYSSENNAKYRDMANKAINDLTEEQKKYKKNSDEYNTIGGYLNYYQQQVPRFDRIDTGLNAQNYISADGWHSADEYEAQRSSLQQSIDAIQAEMDALGETESADYNDLKAYRDWYQAIMDGSDDNFGLAQREEYDRQFKDADAYVQYQRSFDYNNNVQTQKTLADMQAQKTEAEAAFKQAQIDYNLGRIDYQTLALADQEVKKLQDQIDQTTNDLSGLQALQANRIENNFLDQYGEYADYETILNDLIENRNKAEKQYGKNSEAYTKLDLEIKSLAGEKENGTNANGLVDNSTLYGRYLLRNFDADAAQKEIDEIDAKLKEYGLEGTGLGALLGGAPAGGGTGLSIHQDVAEPTEQSKEVRDLRARRVELNRMINSSEALRSKKDIEENLPKVENFDHFVEVGKGATRNNNSAYVLPGYDAEEASLRADYDKSGSLGDFSAIAEDENYKDLANLMYAAIGAEVEGVDIGYSIQDILDAYGEDYTNVEGRRLAKKVNDIDSDFLRWNAQVLGVGTQAGLNQFVSGLKQEFSKDYIAPNSTAVMAQATRQNIGENYGDGNFLGSGSNFSQILFDTTQTTANMLPMIVASSLIGNYAGAAGATAAAAEKIGQIAGATLMGLSSAGNSYQQAISEGWSRKDAMLYSNLMGAAEGGLQYAMGGISKLGGGTEWQDALLNAAKGINNGLVRWMAETGTHIAGEVSEELLQNRIERFLRNQLNAENNEIWAWDDDDWNTVLITVLSTGAMEGPGVGLNLYRNTKTGQQLSGQIPAMSGRQEDIINNKLDQQKAALKEGKTIPAKAQLTATEQNRLVMSEIGKAMKGDPALNYTLLTIGENLMAPGGEAHDLAERMANGKAAKNATNFGELYGLILNEYSERNGATGVDAAMNALIEGAAKYHMETKAQDAVNAAEKQRAEVIKNNPGATVLDANATTLASTYGITNTKVATEYGSVMQKVESGVSLSSSEMSKLLDNSTAAKATRLELDKRMGGTALTDAVENGDIEDAKTIVGKMVQIAKEQKAAARAAMKDSVTQAAQAGADRAEIANAVEMTNPRVNPDVASAEAVDSLQKANEEVETAKQKLDQIKRMSFREIGNLKMAEEAEAGQADAMLSFQHISDLIGQMNLLNKQADKLAAIKMPSKENRTRLADIRQQQAEVKSQLTNARQELVDRAIARAQAQEEAARQEESAKLAQNSSDAVDTIVLPNSGETITREDYVNNAIERAIAENGQLSKEELAKIEEEANKQFNIEAEKSGGKVIEDGRGNESSNPDGQRNDVHTAENGERDLNGESDLGQSEADGPGISETEEEVSEPELGAYPSRQEFPEGGILLEATDANSAVYAGKGAIVYNGFDSWSFQKKGVTPMLGQYLRDSGFTSVRYVSGGSILVKNPKTGRMISVAAVVRGTDMVLALDFKKAGYDPVRTAEHERTHLRLNLLKNTLGEAEKFKFINAALEEMLEPDVYEKAFQKYLAKYGEMYYKNGVTDLTTLGHMIDEEMFCDMAAGLNCWGAKLGEYEGNLADFMSESNFEAIVDAVLEGDEELVKGEEWLGLEYYSGTDENSLPFNNQMKEALNITDPFRHDIDRTKPPEARPLPGEEALHEDQQLMSIQSLSEAATVFGFEIMENEDGYPYGLRNVTTGAVIDQVTPEMMRDTPIGSLVQTAVDNGFIDQDSATKEYELLAETMNLTLKYNDSGLTWELVGSQLFSGIKKNSDTQYNWTMDFGTICRKTQALVDAMSETMKQLGHGLSRREIEAVYLETGLAGEATPCPVCYVFSRWMGIGGLLDDINTFQNTYFDVNQKTGEFKWAEGKSEADLAEYMTSVDNAIVEWAKLKEKKDFFRDEKAADKFSRNNLNFGKILSDMKSSPNRRQADAIKKINDSRQAQLLIAELENRAENTTPEHAAKIMKAADTVREYVLSDDQIAELQTKLEQAEAELAKYDLYQWADRTVMQRVPGKLGEDGERTFQWKARDDYKPVPQSVLFDLNKGGDFAKNYPLTWGFRTGKGNAMGKAIVPYSDARVGETIQGVANKDVKVLNEEMLEKMDVSPADKKAVKRAMKATKTNILSGRSINPLLNGDTKEWNKILSRASDAIQKQNLIGGMRMQSTSDFRFEWGSDYLITFFELQAIGANVQLYTKVIEAVDFLASTNADCNLSVMPLGLGYSVDPETGKMKLDFSNVTGINAEEAIKKAKQYDNVQLILVGISDTNIELALEGTDVTFVIPFHGSGQSVDQVQTLVNLLGEDLDVTAAQDYSDVQDDHIDTRLSKEEQAKAKAMRALRMDIIQGKFWQKPTKKNPNGAIKPFTAEQQALFDDNIHLQRLFDMFYNERPNLKKFTQCMVDADGKSIAYHCFLGKEQAAKIFPYEYWDTSLDYDHADQNGENFKQYCKTLGIIPRFSGVNADGETVDHGNFADKKGYWKLLIDRKMYSNKYDENGKWVGYGAYRNQQKINVSDVKVGMLNESKVQETINEKAWTKPIVSEKTAGIVEKSIDRIAKMHEDGDIYDTKKISKEFRADRLAANQELREAKNANLTNGTVQGYNEDAQQRFSQQEGDNDGRTENTVDSEATRRVVDKVNQLLPGNDWARSFVEAARNGNSGVDAGTAWRTDEKRQQRVRNFAAVFFKSNKFAGFKIDKAFDPDSKKLLFEYGPPDFLNWFFQELAKDPEGLETSLKANLDNADKFLAGINKAINLQEEPEYPRGHNWTKEDEAYMKAIEENDIATLDKMVKQAARKAGFNKEFYQHAGKHFTVFSKGEFGFHLGSWTQAAEFLKRSYHEFWNPNVQMMDPHLSLHLYADVHKPYVLPKIDVWGTGNLRNDYNTWFTSRIAYELSKDPRFEKYLSVLDDIALDSDNDTDEYNSRNRKRITAILEKEGYDALQYTNAAEGNKKRDSGKAYILWNPEQIKSADLITYDEKGYVIPISKRFNPVDTEFRYSMQEETDTTNPFPKDTLENDLMNLALNGTREEMESWINREMEKYDKKKEQAKIIPPRVPSRDFVPKVTPEEKAALENERLNRIGQYGAHELSDQRVSDDYVLPKKTADGKGQMKFYQNAGSAANVLNEPARDVIKRSALVDEVATYDIDHNDADIKAAKNKIQNRGYKYCFDQFIEQAEDMAWSGVGENSITKVLAMGQQLMIEAAANGTYRDLLEVQASLALLANQAGKAMQAFQMLKKSGPIGELYYIQKTVNQLNNKQYAKLIEGKKMSAITVDPELEKAVVFAKTEKEREAAMNNLIASIAKQVPKTVKDKWDTWRHFAMLGNARTHIRNLAGNAIFVPLRFAKDLMSTAGESLAVATGLMNAEDRTKALVVSRDLREFAKKDALVMQKELQGNGKYNPAQEILDARQIFAWKGLDKASKANGALLEKEDWWFLAPAYTKALGMVLQNSGYTVNQLQSTIEGQKALNRARRIAIEEAQRATYRDFSVAAAALNRLKRGGGIGGILLEGVLPFTKTPINILRRGVEYSPVGIATALFGLAKDYHNGSIDAAKFIDRMSAGLSGTMLAAVGILLAKLGWLRGKKDDKEEEFDKLQGYQDYSLQIGDVSMTIDWAAPGALPLFTGVAAWNMMQNDDELQMADLWDAMMLIAEPMMSLSMLDGLNKTLSAASYAGENEKLASIITSAATSYAGQGVPTLLGQLARSLDGTRRQTYVDKDSKVPDAIQRFVQGSVQNKIPVWEEQKAAYIDQWGREDTVNSRFLGALENFLSPSYINMVHTTDVDEELQNLYSATKNASVLPSSPSKKFSSDRWLTADEYVTYAKDVGSTKYNLLAQMFSDPRYRSLTDEQKLKAIEKIYAYAGAAGKYHLDSTYNIRGQGVWIAEAEAMPNDLQRYNRIWEAIENAIKD